MEESNLSLFATYKAIGNFKRQLNLSIDIKCCICF